MVFPAGLAWFEIDVVLAERWEHDFRFSEKQLRLHCVPAVSYTHLDVYKRQPWYRRFGLDHHQQLLNAVLPWYGVANHRLIRDPANAALQQEMCIRDR